MLKSVLLSAVAVAVAVAVVVIVDVLVPQMCTKDVALTASTKIEGPRADVALTVTECAT